MHLVKKLFFFICSFNREKALKVYLFFNSDFEVELTIQSLFKFLFLIDFTNLSINF
jgi:hypothetical protein